METWYLIMKGDDGNRVEIGESQARHILRQWKNNVNAELIGRRPDGSEYLKEVLNRNDWRIQKGKAEREDRRNQRWICDWGTRHKMSEGTSINPNTGGKEWSALNCGCIEKFSAPSTIFFAWCQKFGRVERSADITPDMQREYLKANAI